MFVVRSQESVFHTGHQYRCTFNCRRSQRGEDLCFELPLMVFNEFEFTFVIIAHVCIVLSIPQRVRRGCADREGKLWTTTGIQRVVGRVTLQHQFQVYIMAGTILNQKVRPVMHDIHLIVQSCHELKIVIRPVQTFTVTGRKSEHHDRLIRIICQFVVVVITAIATTVTTIIWITAIIIRHTIIIVVTTDISLFREVSTYGKRIRASASEPRVHKWNTVCLVVASVGLTA